MVIERDKTRNRHGISKVQIGFLVMSHHRAIEQAGCKACILYKVRYTYQYVDRTDGETDRVHTVVLFF